MDDLGSNWAAGCAVYLPVRYRNETTGRGLATIGFFENLLLAFRKARRGKSRRSSVAEFECRLEKELFQLQRELQTGEYSRWTTIGSLRFTNANPG